MRGFSTSIGMKLWKSSKYSRIPSMSGFCICKRCTRFWICLNKPEYALIMPQYACIFLNNAECDSIYRHKSEHNINADYARILNMSLYKLLNRYRDRDASRHCQTFRIERFAKRIMPECKFAPRNISGQGIVERGYFKKYFAQNRRITGAAARNFGNS